MTDMAFDGRVTGILNAPRDDTRSDAERARDLADLRARLAEVGERFRPELERIGREIRGVSDRIAAARATR